MLSFLFYRLIRVIYTVIVLLTAIFIFGMIYTSDFWTLSKSGVNGSQKGPSVTASGFAVSKSSSTPDSDSIIDSSTPQSECWDSPFVDCEQCTGSCVVRRRYRDVYGVHHVVKIDLDFDKLPPGLTAYVANNSSEFYNHSNNTLGHSFHHNGTTSLEDSANTTSNSTTKMFKIAFLNKASYNKKFFRPFSSCEFSNCQHAGNQVDETVDLVVVNGVILGANTPKPTRYRYNVKSDNSLALGKYCNIGSLLYHIFMVGTPGTGKNVHYFYFSVGLHACVQDL